MSEHPLRLSGISIAREKGAPRQNLEAVQVTMNGLENDRLAGPGLRQVAFMGMETAQKFAAATGRDFAPGGGKENLLLDGLESRSLRLMDQLCLGEAVLEITQLGARAAAEGQELCPPDANCAISDYGIFARVHTPGRLQLGMPVRHQQRTLRIRVITLSDRASRGHYEDLSGPRAVELIEDFGAQRGWRIETERQVIQDDAELLEALLVQARQARVSVVITTGGTGMGPRDITPEVVFAHADRIIPGIMEHVRLKYGAKQPLALLSRSVAAICGRTLVFALPGSPKAVEEYLHEICLVLEHLVLVTQGLDPHR